MPNTNRQRSRSEDAKCWYEQFIAWDMTNKNRGISETASKDWNRFVIYDAKKKELVPALQEGHTGHPSEDQMEHLYDAFQKGTLMFYPLGDNHPVQLAAPSDDSALNWKKIEVEKFRDQAGMEDLGEQLQEEPKRETFVKELSGFKRRMNQWFNLFKKDMQDYRDSVARYENALNTYQAQKTAFEEREARQLASAIIKKEEERNAVIESNREKAQLEYRKSNYEDRWKTWRLDRANGALDALFAPRPKRNYPQIAYGNPSKGNTLSESEFQKMEAHGYDLPADSKISQKDAAVINLMLAGAPSITGPAFQKIYGGEADVEAQTKSGYNMLLTGVFFYPRTGMIMEGVHAAFDKAPELINAYQNGDPKPLGKYLAEGVRNFNRCSNDYYDPNSVDKAGLGLLAERILDVLNKYPDLLEASELTQDDLEELQSQVEVSRIFRNSFDAKETLRRAQAGYIQLTPEDKMRCIADIGLNQLMNQSFKESIDAYAASDERMTIVAEASVKAMAHKERKDAYMNKLGKLSGLERMNKDQEWERKHGSYNAYVMAALSHQPMSELQRKLGMPGVADAMIEGYRTLPSLKDNVKDLTPENLIHIMENPKEMGRLLEKSQKGESFQLIPQAPPLEKKVQEKTVVNEKKAPEGLAKK